MVRPGVGIRSRELIGETVKQFDLRDRISAVGRGSLGWGGRRAPVVTVQRQKLALARGVCLKRPELLILNEATAALDGASQSRVHANHAPG